MRVTLWLKTSLVFIALSSIVSVFQACERVQFQNVEVSSSAGSGGGNGDAYGGKPTRYLNTRVNEPCRELGANGRPLPNQVIFVHAPGAALLTRENCTDLQTPRELASNEWRYNSVSQTIQYAGQEFHPLTSFGDFDVVASQCPAGYVPRPDAQRTNMIQNSQELTAAVWNIHPGLGIAFEGTLAGLPRYSIRRQDPNNMDFWRRAAQDPFLVPRRMYSYSFLARPGTRTKALFFAFDQDQIELSIEFDLVSGAGRVLANTFNTEVSLEVRQLGGGFINTVFFTTPEGASQNNIGVTSYPEAGADPAIGDSVDVTAVQLEEVDSYCLKN